MVKIGEIDGAIDKCEIHATVSTIGEVKTYSKTGKYINIELFDGASIKFTLFGNDVNKITGLKVGKSYRFENLRAKLANPNFPCVNEKNCELLPRQDFKWTEIAMDIDSVDKETFGILSEAIIACEAKGVAYCETNAMVKKAEIKTFSAECPNVQCGAAVIENELGFMLCEMCSIEYNACNHNVSLSVDVTIADSSYKMLSYGFAFLNMGSFEFIHMYLYNKASLLSKINALSGREFFLIVKMSMNSSANMDFVIENVTESVPEKDNGSPAKRLRLD